jgi:hypothetical protein
MGRNPYQYFITCAPDGPHSGTHSGPHSGTHSGTHSGPHNDTHSGPQLGGSFGRSRRTTSACSATAGRLGCPSAQPGRYAQPAAQGLAN